VHLEILFSECTTQEEDINNMLEGDMPIDTPEAPLWARMTEVMPGIAASIGFSTMRGSNTLLRGGYMDNASRLGKGVDARRAAKFRVMRGGALSDPGAKQFLGGAARNARMASLTGDARKTPFLRSSRLNNFSLRPRNLTGFHSLSVFADPSQGAYTPFAASNFLGKTKLGQKALTGMGITLKEGETAFGPGMVSAISAGRRVDLLEARAFKGSSRAAKKLAKADRALNMLGNMNNVPGLERGGGQFGRILPKSLNQGVILQPGQTLGASAFGGVTGKGVGQVGVRGNMYASAMGSAGVGFVAGYARGTLGFGNLTGDGKLKGRALEGAKRAEKAFGNAFAKAFGDEGLEIGGKLVKGSEQAVDFLRSTGGKGAKFFRPLGAIATKKLASSGAATFLATRGAAMALPGVQLLAAASFIYDIGQMAGEVVKSGINLAKDANKSLQGSISKPTFGMGYKDTEAAATSRSRGVQAIQNSRLNARSTLGTEGAMMAAHYG
jgi:hypothetical protein